MEVLCRICPRFTAPSESTAKRTVSPLGDAWCAEGRGTLSGLSVRGGQVTNPSKEEFSFTGSFHTYFAASIDDVKVGGLDGLKMTDRLAGKDMTNKGDVTITGPVDACYYDAPKALTLAVRHPTGSTYCTRGPSGSKLRCEQCALQLTGNAHIAWHQRVSLIVSWRHAAHHQMAETLEQTLSSLTGHLMLTVTAFAVY
jgi:hypothetical protein